MAIISMALPMLYKGHNRHRWWRSRPNCMAAWEGRAWKIITTRNRILPKIMFTVRVMVSAEPESWEDEVKVIVSAEPESREMAARFYEKGE